MEEKNIFCLNMNFKNVSVEEFTKLAKVLDKVSINLNMPQLQNKINPASDYKFGKHNGKFWKGFTPGKLTTIKRIVEFFVKEIYENNESPLYKLFFHVVVCQTLTPQEFFDDKDNLGVEIDIENIDFFKLIVERYQDEEIKDIINKIYGFEEEVKEDSEEEIVVENTKKKKTTDTDEIRAKLSKEFEKKLKSETKSLNSAIAKEREKNEKLTLDYNEKIIECNNYKEEIKELKKQIENLNETINMQSTSLEKVDEVFKSIDEDVIIEEIISRYEQDYVNSVEQMVVSKLESFVKGYKEKQYNLNDLIDSYLAIKLMEE